MVIFLMTDFSFGMLFWNWKFDEMLNWNVKVISVFTALILIHIFSVKEPLDNGPLFCEVHFYQRVAKPDSSK